MLIYLLLIGLSLVLLIRNGFFNYKKENDRSFIGVLLILLIIFVGTFRDTTVGTDIGLGGGYSEYWQNPNGFERDLEPLFAYFTLFIKNISDSYYFYYSLIFILNIFFYYLACKKIEVSFSLFLAILFLSSLLTPSFNVIRQMLGLSVGLYMYSVFYYGKPTTIRNIVIFEISIILCSLIHTSVVLLCFIPILDIPAVSQLFSKTWFISLIAVLCILLSSSGINQIIQLVLRFSGVFGERADMYLNVVDNFDIERSHGFLSDLINFTLIIILSRNNRNTLFRICFCGYAFSCLSAATLGVLGRAFDNLLIFSCLYYAQNWSVIMPYNQNKLIVIGAMLLRILFWLTSVYFTVLQNESICPYDSYLF